MADWDSSSPGDSAIIAQFPANERAARAALVTNFGVDHQSADGADVGKHKVVSLLEQSDPSAVAGEGKLYAKDVSSRSELMWRSDTGNAVQLTAGEGLRAESLLGTVADARLSSNVPLKNENNAFSGVNTFLGNDGVYVLKAGGASGRFRVAYNNGAVQIGAVNSAENADVDMTISAETLALSAGTAITLNGVNVTDFARLSQNNTFSGSTDGERSTLARNLSSSSSAYTNLGAQNDSTSQVLLTIASSGFSGPLVSGGPSGISAALRTITAIPLSIATNNTERIRITETGAITLNGVNVTNFARKDAAASISANYTWADSTGAIFGTGGDLTIFHNGTNSYIQSITGDLEIDASAGDNLVLKGDAITLNGVNATDFARLSQQNTFTSSGGIAVASADGGYVALADTDASTDEKRWRLFVSGGSFVIAPESDAASGATAAIGLSRSGTTVTQVALAATTLSLSGNVSTPNSSASEVGYKGAPASSKTADHTIVAADAGNVIVCSSSADDITVQASGAPPAGSVVGVLNKTGGSIDILQGSGMTLTLAGTASTGNRTLVANGMAFIYFDSPSTATVGGSGVA